MTARWPDPTESDVAMLSGTLPAPGFSGGPRLLRGFASPENVSTEKILLAFTPLGLYFHTLSFTLRNHAATPVALYVDRSESGLAANGEREALVIQPGKEGTFRVIDVLDLHWQISAAGDPDNGNPVSQVSWQVVGRRRQPPSIF